MLRIIKFQLRTFYIISEKAQKIITSVCSFNTTQMPDFTVHVTRVLFTKKHKDKERQNVKPKKANKLTKQQ